MTYDADVTSQRAGDAVWLFLFNGPQTVYAYTSSIAAITYDAQAYTPVAGLKTSPRGSSSSPDKRSITVTLGRCDLVTDYAHGIPPQSLRLRIYEYQRRSGQAELIWDGSVTDCNPVGDLTSFQASTLVAEKLNTPVSGVVFQRGCPHRLGDQHCRVDMEDPARKLTALVSAVSPDGYTITVDSIGAFADGEFKAGRIIHDADGEQRVIVRQVGAVLRVNPPFRQIAAPDPVTIYVGCNKSVSYCQSKFDNVVNFGGHPQMPRSNPFTQGLALSAD